MDLTFTPEEQKFREDIRAWVAANLPKHISHKVHNALNLTRDDQQDWGKILGKKGWLGYGWPTQFGGPGWNAIQKHLFEEECAMAGAPRILPFGPVMVAPVIMAFGNAEQQQRFLPGIGSGEVWWSQGYSEPNSGSDLASLRCKAERQGNTYLSTARRPGPHWANLATGFSAWCAPVPKANPKPASAFC
jgi:alkylation response protein AidB-like acyl-CoA dehydrogenase